MAKPKYQLAVSAIAWDYAQDNDVATILQKSGVGAVELAPTKIWPEKIADDPLAVTDEEIEAVLSLWASYGVKPVAMQSMLFLKPEMTIFHDESERQKTLDYLKRFIVLSGRLGVGRMVFGSPKNRQVPETMSVDNAWSIATHFFRELGEEAERNNVIFCIEPNPKDYNCNFVTNATGGAKLVREVNTPGFQLHLDAAGMTLAGDNEQAILDNADILKHFHISAPYLGNISDDTTVQHEKFASALRDIGYDHMVSIEMRPGADSTENLANVESAVAKARSTYLSV